eukprot:933875-Pyramimonas_sp.AAC.1
MVWEDRGGLGRPVWFGKTRLVWSAGLPHALPCCCVVCGSPLCSAVLLCVLPCSFVISRVPACSAVPLHRQPCSCLVGREYVWSAVRLSLIHI